MIKIGTYVWRDGVPKPPCDGCKKSDATQKIYTAEVGIRACDSCMEDFKEKIRREKQ